MCDTEI